MLTQLTSGHLHSKVCMLFCLFVKLYCRSLHKAIFVWTPKTAIIPVYEFMGLLLSEHYAAFLCWTQMGVPTEWSTFVLYNSFLRLLSAHWSVCGNVYCRARYSSTSKDGRQSLVTIRTGSFGIHWATWQPSYQRQL